MDDVLAALMKDSRAIAKILINVLHVMNQHIKHEGGCVEDAFLRCLSDCQLGKVSTGFVFSMPVRFLVKIFFQNWKK